MLCFKTNIYLPSEFPSLIWSKKQMQKFEAQDQFGLLPLLAPTPKKDRRGGVDHPSCQVHRRREVMPSQKTHIALSEKSMLLFLLISCLSEHTAV